MFFDLENAATAHALARRFPGWEYDQLPFLVGLSPHDKGTMTIRAYHDRIEFLLNRYQGVELVKTSLYAEHLTLNALFLDRRGRGKGGYMLARMAQVFERVPGVVKIKAHALRRDEMQWNGYYAWARLGFDAPLDNDHLQYVPRLRGDETRIRDFMGTPEGRLHWRRRGVGFKGEFTPQDVAYLQAYLDSREGETRG